MYLFFSEEIQFKTEPSIEPFSPKTESSPSKKEPIPLKTEPIQLKSESFYSLPETFVFDEVKSSIDIVDKIDDVARGSMSSKSQPLEINEVPAPREPAVPVHVKELDDHGYSLPCKLLAAGNKRGRKPKPKLAQQCDDDVVMSDDSQETTSVTDSIIGLVRLCTHEALTDHGYCYPFDLDIDLDTDSDVDDEVEVERFAVETESGEFVVEDVPHIVSEIVIDDFVEPPAEVKIDEEKVSRKRRRLSDVTNLSENRLPRELARLLPAVVAPVKQPKLHYQKRDFNSEMRIIFEIVTKGIDAEDMAFIKIKFNEFLQHDMNDLSKWVNETHWVDHAMTYDYLSEIPPEKRFKRSRHDNQEVFYHTTGMEYYLGYSDIH